ncbi:MAG: FmdB family zinc ribbon protein [Acidimicrobiales bacterium]
MPTYEYRCRDCGEDLEVVQAFSDDALTECPTCGGSLRKIFGNIGISFKGSGFYKTDARGTKKAPAESASSDSSSSDSSSSDSSSGSDASPSGDSKKPSPATSDASSKKPKPEKPSKSEPKSA